MIYLYTGTPGSGKSLNVARDIYYRLNRNKKHPNVIANFAINQKMIKNKKANFIYKDNSELSIEFLLQYAAQNHVLGIENQTLVVVDECSVIWNSRDWNNKEFKSSRSEWLKFFVQHRKLGYNFILITQNDRQIDRQIRSLVEYEVEHRKLNNFKIGKLLPFSTFIAISRWYGVNEKLGIEYFKYSKKWGNFYDSYGTFNLDNTLSDIFHNSTEGEKGVSGAPISPSVKSENNNKKLNKKSIKGFIKKDNYLYYFLFIIVIFSSYMFLTV